MRRQILAVVEILVVFIGGLLLGWLAGERSQKTVCAAQIAEAKQKEHSVCETLLSNESDISSRLTDSYIRLQKQCAGQ